MAEPVGLEDRLCPFDQLGIGSRLRHGYWCERGVLIVPPSLPGPEAVDCSVPPVQLLRSQGKSLANGDRSPLPIPLYFQLKTLLLEEILSGRYGPEQRLPTERELCERYRISRTPVTRALTKHSPTRE